MYVRAEFSPVEAKEAILAPQQAISRDVKGNATALVVSADSKAEMRALVADRTVGDKWLVTSGLKPGDKLIVEGLSRVKPGQSVKPVAVNLQPAARAARLGPVRRRLNAVTRFHRTARAGMGHLHPDHAGRRRRHPHAARRAVSGHRAPSVNVRANYPALRPRRSSRVLRR